MSFWCTHNWHAPAQHSKQLGDGAQWPITAEFLHLRWDYRSLWVSYSTLAPESQTKRETNSWHHFLTRFKADVPVLVVWGASSNTPLPSPLSFVGVANTSTFKILNISSKLWFRHCPVKEAPTVFTLCLLALAPRARLVQVPYGTSGWWADSYTMCKWCNVSIKTKAPIIWRNRWQNYSSFRLQQVWNLCKCWELLLQISGAKMQQYRHLHSCAKD